MTDVRPFGDRAAIVDLPDSDPAALASALRQALPQHSVRVGLSTVLVLAEEPSPALVDGVALAVEKALPSLASPSVRARSTDPLVVDVRYDGSDLGVLASDLGVSQQEIVRAHREAIWRVALVGFAPGFPYLVPVSGGELFAAATRLSSPRSSVPAGSVAVAAGMSSIYPQPMPGGWNLIGTTDLTLFDPERMPPSILNVGDLVRFREEVR